MSLESDERRRLIEQYSEIAQLAGGLAHEIRNPLSTIGVNLELLAEELSGDDSARDHRLLRRVRTIQGQCETLEQVLNAFLRFASLGEFETEPVDLNEVVREFVDFDRPIAEEHGVSVTTHLAADLPHIDLDRGLVRQVLANLVRNAREAMPDGGPLEIQTRGEDGVVALEVIDGGCGISEAVRARIFDAFFSTRPGGSGLGLPTVRRIVEAHGGTISCDTETGRGTRFTIRWPTSR